MKVIVIVKATKASEAGELPSEELLTEMGQYNEELIKAGIMLDGGGLHPSSQGVRVRFSGENRTVIEGPFAATNHLVAGYWIWRVDSMAQAIDWVKRCPNPLKEDSDIEIRRLFEADDFGDSFTPELREQEAAILAQTIGLNCPRFENGGKLLIAGLNHCYSSQTASEIPTQWVRFVERLQSIAGLNSNVSYGVVWNCNDSSDFDYVSGVEVSADMALPSDFFSLTIPASRYVVFEHSGQVSKLAQTVDMIWAVRQLAV